MKPQSTPLATKSVCLVLLGLAVPGFAQTANNKDEKNKLPAAQNEPAVELTPFEVRTDRDRGYAATETLAGTRLNSPLKDISSPIQVVTEQFINDVGATDLASLLVYATNTEIGGLAGNYYEADPTLGNANGVFAGPEAKGNSSGRVRGLQGPDRTRNYFQSDIPLDTFNLQSVEIQRGPNSILFGLGSPAGLINSSFKQPIMDKHRFGADWRFDRWGSSRVTVDANVPIVPKLLAVRLIGLHKEGRFEQEPAFDDSQRLYAALRFNPRIARNITTDINVGFETGSGHANSPNTAPPRDNISAWYTYLNKWSNPSGGWPSNYNTVPAQAPYLAGSQGAVGGWSNEPGLIFPDPNSSITGYGSGLVDATRRNSTSSTQYIAVANPTAGANFTNHYLSQLSYYRNNPIMLGIIENFQKVSGQTFTQASGFGWRPAQILDRSIFDYKKEMLQGPSNQDWEDFNNLNASLRQTFFGGRLGYELTFDKQKYDNKSVYLMARADTIDVEINAQLRDNVTPNPNFGRPVVAARTSGQMRWRDREAYRFQAYYNLDFKDVLRSRESLLTDIIGKHTFTLSGSDQKYHSLQYGFWPIKWGDGYTANFDLQDVYFGVHYLNAAVDTKNASTLANAHIHGIGVAQTPKTSGLTVSGALSNNLVTKVGNDLWTYYQPEGTTRLIHNTSDKEMKSDAQSKVFVWQSHLFSDNVVGLFGLRKDVFKRWQKPVQGNDVTYLPGNGIHNRVGDPYSGKWIYDPPLVAAGTTRSYGVMAHSPNFINRHLPWGLKLSLGYNAASNFNPSNSTTDPYGNQNPSPSGKTQDLTVQLRMLDDRLTVRVTKFKTNQINITDTGSITGVAQNMKVRLVRALNGLSLDTQATAGNVSKNTNPEWVVNKWFFGDSYDKNVALTPLPAGWTVNSHPELLKEPMRVRADYFKADPTNAALNQPLVTLEETEYRAAWFRARTEAEWARPIGLDLYRAFGLTPDYNRIGSGNGMFLESANSTIAGISDQRAKGTEIEITYNPKPNWRIAVSASHTQAADTNAWGNLEKYINTFKAVAFDGYDPTIPRGTKIRYWQRNGFATLDGTGDGNAEMLGWFWYSDVQLQYLLKRAQDGKNIDQMRPYRFSGTTSYDFRSGYLKGFGVGGSIRWQDKITLGYYPMYDPGLQNWISDVTKPIRGADDTSVDAWISYRRKLREKVQWTVQFNARNLNAKDDVIAAAANGDGSIGTFRIRASPTWELTNRFEF